MTNTVATLNGYFKEVYADNIEDLLPDGVMIHKDTRFVGKSQQTGNKYHQPVVLTYEHGFTYAAASSGAFALNAAIAATHKDATVVGSQILLETRIDYETAHRGNGSPKAFGSVTKHIMENMMNSMYKRLEIEYVYGGAGSIWCGITRLGSRVSGSGTTSQVYNIYAGHWAPGIMAGLENCPVDAYNDNGAGGLPSSKLNATADIIIASVDFTNKRVTLTGVAAELDALASPSAAAAYLYFKGAFGNEMTGLVTIASNTGTLFDIAGGTYAMWQGNTFDVGGSELTFSAAMAGHDPAVGRGLSEDVTQYVNPGAWTSVMSDQAALRRFTGESGRKLTNGATGIQFDSHFGSVTYKPYLYMKEGISLSLPTKRVKRLGATDVTFNVPGGDEMIYQLPNNAGWGVRAYANQAIFLDRPYASTLFYNIQNS